MNVTSQMKDLCRHARSVYESCHPTDKRIMEELCARIMVATTAVMEYHNDTSRMWDKLTGQNESETDD